MRGGVKHGETTDCWLATSLDVEEKFLGHSGADMKLAGFIMDFVKAHNRIVRKLVFYVAERLGLTSVNDAGLLKACQAFVGNCMRRFRLAGDPLAGLLWQGWP